MAKRLSIIDLPVIYLKEGDAFICYTPVFDLSAHGDSFEDASRSFAQTLKLFIEEVTKNGTWEEVLQECGWEKVKNAWTPPGSSGRNISQSASPSSPKLCRRSVRSTTDSLSDSFKRSGVISSVRKAIIGCGIGPI